MNGYDIDFLRALRPVHRSRGTRVAFVVLLALGVVLFAAELVLRRDLAARQRGARATLEERARAAEAPPASLRPEAAVSEAFVRARADRVPWKAVLVSVAESLPRGDHLERLSFDAEAGALRLDVRSGTGTSADALVDALEGDTLFTRFFPVVRSEASGPSSFSVHCDRGSS